MPALASFIVLVLVVFLNSCPGGQIRFAAPADFSVGVPSRPIAARIPASRCFSGAHAFFGLTREPPFLWPFFPNGLLVTASRRYSARTSSGSAMRKFSHCPSGMCRIKTLRQPRRHLPDRLAASQSQLRFRIPTADASASTGHNRPCSASIVSSFLHPPAVELNFRSGVCFPAKGLNDSRIAGPSGIVMSAQSRRGQLNPSKSQKSASDKQCQGPLLWQRRRSRAKACFGYRPLLISPQPSPPIHPSGFEDHIAGRARRSKGPRRKI
jgi:hypothetical protein